MLVGRLTNSKLSYKQRRSIITECCASCIYKCVSGSLVGWGLNEIDRPVDVLMQIKLPVVSQETCLRSFPEFFSRYTSSTTLCAGYRNGL